MKLDIHGDLPQEAPGDKKLTAQAYLSLPSLPPQPNILDIGCGPGTSTIELAKLSGGNIIALDLSQTFLDELNRRAVIKNVHTSIKTVHGSMSEIHLPEKSFDLIWAEGAIYLIGVQKGITYWRKFLKPKGYVVFSELSWLTSTPSNEIESFWKRHYADMKSVNQNVTVIKNCGYNLIGQITFPEKAWWNYYTPWEKKLLKLQSEHVSNPSALKRIDKCLNEIKLYRKHHQEYSYVFYICQSKN